MDRPRGPGGRFIARVPRVARNVYDYAKWAAGALGTAGALYYGAKQFKGAANRVYHGQSLLGPGYMSHGGIRTRKLPPYSATLKKAPFVERGKKFIGKGKKRKRTIKGHRKSKKTIKKESHGIRATMRFHQRYYIDSGSNIQTQVGTIIGGPQLASQYNKQEMFAIPLFTESQMQSEFKTGESTAGSGTIGYLDPPVTLNYSAGAVNGTGLNLQKVSEVISIDKLTCKLFLSNLGDTKMEVNIQEWICNQESNKDFFWSATNLYNSQDCFQTYYPGGGVPVAEPNLLKDIDFNISKVPDLHRAWKKGSYKANLELLAGESLEQAIVFKNIRWDKQKFNKISDSAATYEYHRNMSRMIVVTFHGVYGYDVSASGGTAGTVQLQKTQLGFDVHKELTAHRVDLFGAMKRRYICNPQGLIDINPVVAGSTQTVTELDTTATTVGPVNLYNPQLYLVS